MVVFCSISLGFTGYKDFIMYVIRSFSVALGSTAGHRVIWLIVGFVFGSRLPWLFVVSILIRNMALALEPLLHPRNS